MAGTDAGIPAARGPHHRRGRRRCSSAGEVSSVDLTRACLDRIARDGGAAQHVPRGARGGRARRCGGRGSRTRRRGRAPAARRAVRPQGHLRHPGPGRRRRAASRAACPRPPGRGSWRATARRTPSSAEDRLQRRRGRAPGQDQLRRVRHGLVERELAPTDRSATPGTRRPFRAAPPAAPPRRWPAARRSSPSGTDTGGSIRQPASLSGIVGMKPTYGRVSRYGMVAFASSLDQCGPLTRSVADCALVLGAVAGHDPRDSTSVDVPGPGLPCRPRREIRGLRLGVPREYFVAGMEPGVERAVRAAIDVLGGLGAEIVEVSLPSTDKGLATYYIIAPGGGEREPGPLRRGQVRPERRRGRSAGELPAHPRGRVRAGGEAADHARHVRALGRLLRRVLRQGPAGAHPDQGGVRPGPGRCRRAPGPDLAQRGLQDRRQGRRSAAHVPQRRLHAAREHRRPARGSACRAASPMACRWACR